MLRDIYRKVAKTISNSVVVRSIHSFISNPTVLKLAEKVLMAEVGIGLITTVGSVTAFVAMGNVWFAVGAVASYVIGACVKYTVRYNAVHGVGLAA